MTPFMTRKRLLFWIAVAMIALVTEVVVVNIVRRMNSTRRSVYIVGRPDRGAQLFYGDKRCNVCHTMNGSGGRLAPDLTGARPESPAMGWLTAKLWNHGPGMWRQLRRQNKPLPDLDVQEMADMLAFLYQASSVDPPGDAFEGRQVFHAKGCVRCHSVGATGGKSAPELSKIAPTGDPNDWTRAMLNHAGSMIAPITKALGQWPQFQGREMNDLIAFVTVASPQPGHNGPALKGTADRGWKVFQARCIQCHSVRGQGGNIGPALGPEMDLRLTTSQLATAMWNHAPAMLHKGQESNVPPPMLEAGEMADLLVFLASLRYFEPIGSPQIGERVFAERGCASCHGANAEGTKSGARLKPENEAYTAVSFTTKLWRHGPRMIERVDEMGMQWPELESNDIGNLVSFLNAPPNTK
ncbi:MAG: c-type cytochrome [Terriglobales bacterium]